MTIEKPGAQPFSAFTIAQKGNNSDPATAAHHVTKASRSNLNAVGRFLSPQKRTLFEAAYASMRIIDDFVDDGFLACTASHRIISRDQAHRVVSNWLETCSQALIDDAGQDLQNHPYAKDQDILINNGAEPLYDALHLAALKGAPGPRPWQLLAQAMHHDIDEEIMMDWQDFLRYCEGATVAPAMIFLFVLTARPDQEQGGKLISPLNEEELFNAARPMALFCYLVHILRDLAKDARRDAQLITVPQLFLHEFDLDRLTLGRAIAKKDKRVAKMAQALGQKAGDYRQQTIAMRDHLSPNLGFRERSILLALTSIYEKLHDRLTSAPFPFDDQVAHGTHDIIKDVFNRTGLSDPEEERTAR